MSGVREEWMELRGLWRYEELGWAGGFEAGTKQTGLEGRSGAGPVESDRMREGYRAGYCSESKATGLTKTEG